jgi:hypothetical protein
MRRYYRTGGSVAKSQQSLDETEMAHKVGETIGENGRTILTGEGHKIVVPSGVCSDHASKAPGDCCRKTTRKATQANSGENR